MGGPHKRILFESEDPDSTVSGSETQEARLGWPPDDMCTDSTQYRGSFDDRDRDRLRLLSPTLQQRVLKLQRDLSPDTPISDIVDRCRVWESHDESNSRPMARHEPTGPRGVFQVTQQISDEHSEMFTEPDPAPSEFEILAQRLREMAQQPVPANSDTIDIEQLLKQLLPVDTEVEETERPTSRASGNVASVGEGG